MARDRQELANVTIRLSKHVPGAETLITLLQTALTLEKTCRKCGKVGHVVSVCRSSGTPEPKAKGGQKGKGGGKGANDAKTFWNCGENGHMSSRCPKKKVHSVEESTTASQAGSSQDTIMVGSVGSCFDVGSVSEVTLEPRGADEKICSMSASNVREGESVCLPANIDADTYPLHETRVSVCGGHHVAAGGGELPGLGAVVVGKRSSLLTVETCISPGKLRTLASRS